MRKGIKKFWAVLLMLIMCLAITSTALASEETDFIDQWATTNVGINSAGNIYSAKSSKVAGYFFTADNAPDGAILHLVILSNGTEIYYDESQASVISQTISKIENVDISGQLSDITNGLGIVADIQGGANMLSGLSGAISTFLGLVVTLVSIGVFFFTGLDVIYMAFPTFQNNVTDAVNSGGASGAKTFVGTDKKTGETKIRWINREAVNAVQKSIETGKNVFLIYLWARMAAIIALFIVIFIFATGNFTVILTIVGKGLEGILRAIQGLA